MFEPYQLKIIAIALHYLHNDYDEYDLEDMMYSGSELEAEISTILAKIKEKDG